MPAKKVPAAKSPPAVKKAAPKKAPANSVAIIAATSNAVSTDTTDWRSRLADRANKGREQMAKAPGQGGNFLSFKGATITFQKQPIGQKLAIVALHPQFERAYYMGAYDPDNPRAPECYSFDDIKPHEKSEDPQSPACANCKWNEFKTAENGKGKACKEVMRLALLAHRDDPVKYDTDPIAIARLSTMNAKALKPQIDGLYDRFGHPANAKLELTIKGHPLWQYELGLNYVGDNDPAAMEHIVQRLDAAEQLLIEPYQKNETPTAPPRNLPGAKGKPGARKSTRF